MLILKIPRSERENEMITSFYSSAVHPVASIIICYIPNWYGIYFTSTLSPALQGVSLHLEKSPKELSCDDKFAQVMSRMANSQYCYMMTSSNGTFSAYLVLCEGNPPVTGGFPSQRPVTRSFDVFFDLRMKKRSSKQSRHRWFARPSCPLWRHCNVMNPHYYLCCKLDDGSAEDRAFIYCLAQTIA